MPHKILIVDDQPVNVQLLMRKLEREGFAPEGVYSGQEALDSVARAHPDLILLDVMMPDMDGIEVCARLQNNEATRNIPVIFVTARGAREHKIEGLSAGAVDYITKPVDLDEMVARVRTQLRVVDLQRRLSESRRAATLGAMTQGIAHNLNNMLAIILGYVDLIKLHHNKPENVSNHAAGIEKAVKRIAGVIKQLNALVIRTRPPASSVPLQTLLDGGIARYRADYGITAPVTVDNPLGALVVDVHVESFEDLLAKLLVNAWESYGSTNLPAPGAATPAPFETDGDTAENRPIIMRTNAATTPSGAPAFEIHIEDRGRGLLGLPPEIRDHIFEPFVSTKQSVGVGMGLSIARRALRTLGGDLHLADREGGGATATILCPVGQKVEGLKS